VAHAAQVTLKLLTLMSTRALLAVKMAVCCKNILAPHLFHRMDAIRTSHQNWMMSQQIATAGHLEDVLPIFEEQQNPVMPNSQC
jgi:hypothetical protein